MDIRVARSLMTLMTVSSLHAADSVLTIEPGSSQVTFTLQATAHKVHGTFAVASGEVRFDPAGGMASGSIVVDATSGDTDNKKRDKKMHLAVLRSGEYPRIVFEPVSFSGSFDPAGGGELQVSGILQLLGIDHEVKLPVEVAVDGDALRMRASLTVPYVEWGLKDPSFFVLRVGKTVQVEIDLVGRLVADP